MMLWPFRSKARAKKEAILRATAERISGLTPTVAWAEAFKRYVGPVLEGQVKGEGMNIIRKQYPDRQCAEEIVNLTTFADRHGLSLKIEEQWQRRTFSASLEPFVEIMNEGGTLSGCSGSGHTEVEAIADLCQAMSRRRLVTGAWKGQTRREFDAPTVVSPTLCTRCGRALPDGYICYSDGVGQYRCAPRCRS